MEKLLKEIKDDFYWVKRVISSEKNKCIHYDGLKNLTANFANKWKHISKKHPDLYHSYVNYLSLKLRYEFNDK